MAGTIGFMEGWLRLPVSGERHTPASRSISLVVLLIMSIAAGLELHAVITAGCLSILYAIYRGKGDPHPQ